MAASILFLFVACRAPLQITDIKINDNCDILCMSWTTNYEAKCKVTFCDLDQCYATDEEPEWGKLHSTSIPKGAHNIQIHAEGRYGQANLCEYK